MSEQVKLKFLLFTSVEMWPTLTILLIIIIMELFLGHKINCYLYYFVKAASHFMVIGLPLMLALYSPEMEC